MITFKRCLKDQKWSDECCILYWMHVDFFLNVGVINNCVLKIEGIALFCKISLWILM